MMRLPFISSRKAAAAMCLLVEVSRRAMAEKDQLLDEERASRRNAELEIAHQQRVIKQLTDQLLDATGYQGEPLLPAARRVLGIEDAKEES